MMNSFVPSSFLKKAFIYPRPLRVFVLILSLSVAFSVWVVSKNYYENRGQERYDEYVNLSIVSMKERFSIYESLLHSGIGFFEGCERVNHSAWHDFVQALELAEHYPGMQGLGFAVMLNPNETTRLEKEMREEGLSSFSIKPVGKRSQYSAIVYLEPLDKRNIEAIGYDMYSEHTRRKAM